MHRRTGRKAALKFVERDALSKKDEQLLLAEVRCCFALEGIEVAKFRSADIVN